MGEGGQGQIPARDHSRVIDQGAGDVGDGVGCHGRPDGGGGTAAGPAGAGQGAAAGVGLDTGAVGGGQRDVAGGAHRGAGDACLHRVGHGVARAAAGTGECDAAALAARQGTGDPDRQHLDGRGGVRRDGDASTRAQGTVLDGGEGQVADLVGGRGAGPGGGEAAAGTAGEADGPGPRVRQQAGVVRGVQGHPGVEGRGSAQDARLGLIGDRVARTRPSAEEGAAPALSAGTARGTGDRQGIDIGLAARQHRELARRQVGARHHGIDGVAHGVEGHGDTDAAGDTAALTARGGQRGTTGVGHDRRRIHCLHQNPGAGGELPTADPRHGGVGNVVHRGAAGQSEGHAAGLSGAETAADAEAEGVDVGLGHRQHGERAGRREGAVQDLGEHAVADLVPGQRAAPGGGEAATLPAGEADGRGPGIRLDTRGVLSPHHEVAAEGPGLR